jgi:3-oxo-5-alpha-steroid 4-dehydrogenase 1
MSVYDPTYDFALLVGYLTALITLIFSVFVTAPYGRFGDDKYGMLMNPRVGWWLMEIFATLSFAFFYPQGPNALKPVPLFFAFLFACHYANRGWYFPYHMRVAPGSKASFSILVAVSGFFVTALHGYLNAMWYSKYCDYLDWDWLSNPTFIFGFILYEASFWSTIYTESIMRNLRPKPTATLPATSNSNSPSSIAAANAALTPIFTPATPTSRYTIPRGFLFEYVTSPQYFTELLGFLGWAIMTWSPAGLFIFFISCANLLPRAKKSHQWYKHKFEDYPTDRKVMVPFLW